MSWSVTLWLFVSVTYCLSGSVIFRLSESVNFWLSGCVTFRLSGFVTARKQTVVCKMCNTQHIVYLLWMSKAGIKNFTVYCFVRWRRQLLNTAQWRVPTPSTELSFTGELFVDPWLRIRIRMVAGSEPASKFKAGFGSALESKFRSFRGSKWSCGEPWTFTVEPWMICRLVVVDKHHFDEDPAPH